MSDAGEENEMAALLEHKKKQHAEEEKDAMASAYEELKAEQDQLAEEIRVLREKQQERQKRKQKELEKMEEIRKIEEAKRREEEAERRRVKDEEKEKKREEKERKKREKEERAKNMGKKNFKIKKAEKSSLDQVTSVDMEEYNTEQSGGEMAKSKEQLEEEKRAILAQRIVPLNTSGMNQAALLEKVKELHDKLYKLESDKYDLDDRFQRQQYDMMELSERARQMNKGKGTATSLKIAEDEPIGPCPFDRVSDKYSNAPPRVQVASKYDRNVDKRNFFEKMGCFEKEWVEEDGTGNADDFDD